MKPARKESKELNVFGESNVKPKMPRAHPVVLHGYTGFWPGVGDLFCRVDEGFLKHSGSLGWKFKSEQRQP